MGYHIEVSDGQDEALDAAADVLLEPRALMVKVAEEWQWSAHPRSMLAIDRSSRKLPDDVRAKAAEFPRVVASLFLRTGCDDLAAIGALFRAREVVHAPGVLARSTLENGARAVWVLQPGGDDQGTVRRVARAMLEEVVTAHYAKQAVARLAGKSSDGWATLHDRQRAVKALAVGTFGEEAVSFANDPAKWSIGGVGYPRINDAIENWTDHRDDDLPGAGIYDYLSMYGHPQGLASRDNLFEDTAQPSDTAVTTDLSTLGKLALAGLAAWVDGFELLTSYHGIEYDPEDEFLGSLEPLNRLADQGSKTS